jgi:hypothetical protein
MPRKSKRLLADADSALAEFGYTAIAGEHMVVLEKTPTAIASATSSAVRPPK